MILYYHRSGTSIILGSKPTTELNKWSAIIKLRQPIGKYTKLEISTDQLPPFSDLLPLQKIYRMPVLKSSLQKAIRRRLTVTATAIAYQMLRQNAGEVLRRLPVIMLEDTILQPHYLTLLVWYMVAVSKGWPIDHTVAYIIAESIAIMCACPIRDTLSMASDEDAQQAIDNIKNPIIYNAIISAMIRVRYGGMTGDGEFIRELIIRWVNRSNRGFIVPTVYAVAYDLRELRPENMIPQGVDYHCIPYMFDILRQQNVLTAEDDECRLAIWFHRSSINKRTEFISFESVDKLRIEKLLNKISWSQNKTKILYDKMVPHLRQFVLQGWKSEPVINKSGEKIINKSTTNQKTLFDYFNIKNK